MALGNQGMQFIARLALGPALALIALFALPSLASAAPQTQSFQNNTGITIPAQGTATTYPSTVAVSGMDGTVTQVHVFLNSFTHTNAADVGVVLESPSGERLMLQSSDTGTANVLSASYGIYNQGQGGSGPIPGRQQRRQQHLLPDGAHGGQLRDDRDGLRGARAPGCR